MRMCEKFMGCRVLSQHKKPLIGVFYATKDGVGKAVRDVFA